MFDLTVNIGESKISSLILVGQPFMIDPQKMQDGRLHVMNMHAVVGDINAVIVGFSISETAPNTPAGDPH